MENAKNILALISKINELEEDIKLTKESRKNCRSDLFYWSIQKDIDNLEAELSKTKKSILCDLSEIAKKYCNYDIFSIDKAKNNANQILDSLQMTKPQNYKNTINMIKRVFNMGE